MQTDDNSAVREQASEKTSGGSGSMPPYPKTMEGPAPSGAEDAPPAVEASKNAPGVESATGGEDVDLEEGEISDEGELKDDDGGEGEQPLGAAPATGEQGSPAGSPEESGKKKKKKKKRQSDDDGEGGEKKKKKKKKDKHKHKSKGKKGSHSPTPDEMMMGHPEDYLQQPMRPGLLGAHPGEMETPQEEDMDEEMMYMRGGSPSRNMAASRPPPLMGAYPPVHDDYPEPDEEEEDLYPRLAMEEHDERDERRDGRRRGQEEEEDYEGEEDEEEDFESMLRRVKEAVQNPKKDEHEAEDRRSPRDREAPSDRFRRGSGDVGRGGRSWRSKDRDDRRHSPPRRRFSPPSRRSPPGRRSSPVRRSPPRRRFSPPARDRERRDHSRDRDRGRERERDRDHRERDRDREHGRDRHIRERDRDRHGRSSDICSYYMAGKCQRGDDCPFSHDATPPRKNELCKFYMLECCAKKDKCLYMHKDFPCKYYHTGAKCFAADRCKFSHGPLNEITKPVLLRHLETAPKDILGDFPRMTAEGARAVVEAVEKKRLAGIKLDEESGSPKNDVESADDELDRLAERRPSSTEARSSPKRNGEPAKPAPLKRGGLLGDRPGELQDTDMRSFSPKMEGFGGSAMVPAAFPLIPDAVPCNAMGDIDVRPRDVDFRQRPAERKLKPSGYSPRGDIEYSEDEEKDMLSIDEGPANELPPPAAPLDPRLARKRKSTVESAREEEKAKQAPEPATKKPKVEEDLPPLSEQEEKMFARLPPLQRELFLRIKRQEAMLGASNGDVPSGGAKDTKSAGSSAGGSTPVPEAEGEENWYSSDEEEGKPKSSRESKPESIRDSQRAVVIPKQEVKRIQEAKPALSTLPPSLGGINIQALVSKLKSEAKNPKIPSSISIPASLLNLPGGLLGMANKEEKPLSQDLKNALFKDSFDKVHELDSHGDTDARMQSSIPGMAGGKVSLSLPFLTPDHVPCTEIRAGINSHPPMEYKLIPLLDLPKFSYESMDLPLTSLNEAQLRADPRINRRRRTSSSSESPRGAGTSGVMESPASPPEDPRRTPKAAGSESPRSTSQPSKGPVRGDPRRRPTMTTEEEGKSAPRSLDPRLNRMAPTGDTDIRRENKDPRLARIGVEDLDLRRGHSRSPDQAGQSPGMLPLPDASYVNPLMEQSMMGAGVVPFMSMSGMSMQQMAAGFENAPPGPNAGPGLLGAGPPLGVGGNWPAFGAVGGPWQGGIPGGRDDFGGPGIGDWSSRGRRDWDHGDRDYRTAN